MKRAIIFLAAAGATGVIGFVFAIISGTEAVSYTSSAPRPEMEVDQVGGPHSRTSAHSVDAAVLDREPIGTSTENGSSVASGLAELPLKNPVPFAVKYQDASEGDMLAAYRKTIADYSKASEEHLRQQMEAGNYEVVEVATGEPLPTQARDEAIRCSQIPTTDGGKSIFKVTRFRPKELPKTMVLVKEISWLGSELQSKGIDP